LIEKKTKKNGSFYFSEKNNLTHMRVEKEDEREKKEEERKELLCCFCRLSSREGHVVWSTDDWSERFFFVGFDRE